MVRMKENQTEEVLVTNSAECGGGGSSYESLCTETKSTERSAMEAVTSNMKSGNESDGSGDDKDHDTPKTRKKRVQRFSNSESETENTKTNGSCESDPGSKSPFESNSQVDSKGRSDRSIFKSLSTKSRIRRVSDSTDSDTAGESGGKIALKNKEQQSRMKNKRNRMRQKFKSLVTSREKEQETIDHKESQEEDTKVKSSCEERSGDEASSIEKIKQKIKERTKHLKSTIYDPDTSDEERSLPKSKTMQVQKNGRKSTKLTSSKPIRMSAKQAMENMQKIKSESNRMLREKDISLPYHRPKALSLKDILGRRKPAVSSDGKALPIKMNEEQLKHYVILLEQRQKEMLELCKSDTEEEDTLDNETKEDIPSNNDSMYDDLIKINETSTRVKENLVDTSNIDQNHEINSNLTVRLTEEIICNKGDNYKTKQIVSDTDDKTTFLNGGSLDGSSNADTPSHDNLNDRKEDETAAVAEGTISTEIELVYNDSIDDTKTANVAVKDSDDKGEVMENTNNSEQDSKLDTEPDSQMVSLHYDTEKSNQLENVEREVNTLMSEITEDLEVKVIEEENKALDFSDDDINMEDIDNLIENAEILSQPRGENINSPLLVTDQLPSKNKPKLIGAPGMVIDLNGPDSFAPKKLTGVELLRERFTYFAKLKTPEELEKERENRIKPGLQHLKLRQELEEKIAEQRSLDWAKRLEYEKQQQLEIDAVRVDGLDAEDDIDKIEAKLQDYDDAPKESSESEEEEEEDEEMNDIEEKPRKRNPMIEDEAEESDCDVVELEQNNHEVSADDNDDDLDDAGGDNEESDEESSEVESEEEQSKPKKGRILKAFEDSDEEDISTKLDQQMSTVTEATNKPTEKGENNEDLGIKDTQDDELQLAQMHKSFSDDLFNSQESASIVSKEMANNKSIGTSSDDNDLGTQTFSILNTGAPGENDAVDFPVPVTDSLVAMGDTLPYEEGNLDHIVGMCSGSFSQNLVTPQYPSTQQSQDLGDDVLALCTGKFYDNQFVSQLGNDNIGSSYDKIPYKDVDINTDNTAKIFGQEDTCNGDKNAATDNNENQKYVSDNINNIREDISQNYVINQEHIDLLYNKNEKVETVPSSEEKVETVPSSEEKVETVPSSEEKVETVPSSEEKNLLKSILDELHDPNFETQKPNKYFVGNDNQNKENKQSVANSQAKKKFIIDSDDESAANGDKIKNKKLKKKKIEKRALQISDDEEDYMVEEADILDEAEDDVSEIDDTEKIGEYDSEENEVIVQPENRKKKRKAVDFFEQEAELTSEDEWAGSGDEDEAGLDRMEREAGDDDTFNQGRLQRELGQIHMRDVLDQDKRDVRLIQELLFEDGDLGEGHRQRKFRWKNADGKEDTDPAFDVTDTQEEEFESEEQWRKQRHEKEMFLKQMKNDESEDNLNVSVTRSSIIKANLSSRTMSSLLLEANTSKTENTEKAAPVSEKNVPKELPSPQKPFIMFQQNYHNSLLTRGRGALARLAALVTPLAGDDNAPKAGSLGPSSKRNFVFTALTPDEDKPKVNKRKADSNVGTPRLVKKLRTEEKRKHTKNSLLDHLKA